jgi:hypothetical protein
MHNALTNKDDHTKIKNSKKWNKNVKKTDIYWHRTPFWCEKLPKSFKIMWEMSKNDIFAKIPFVYLKVFK